MANTDTKNAPFYNLAMDFFFPHYCRQCGVKNLDRNNHFFCPTCWDASPRVLRPFCVKCGKPHPGMSGFGSPSNIVCADCRDHPNPQISRICGAALYDNAAKEAIRLFKFHNKHSLRRVLGDLMSTFALEEMDCEDYDYIVPVPLHRIRQRERGFNQSALLSEEIVRYFPNAAVDESLKRIRPTKAQSRLKEDERQENVRGAFAVEGDPYQGKKVLLVDDVVTTAVTVSECARALRRAGAANVDVLAATITAHHRGEG